MPRHTIAYVLLQCLTIPRVTWAVKQLMTYSIIDSHKLYIHLMVRVLVLKKVK